jgi:hypothetical protein
MKFLAFAMICLLTAATAACERDSDRSVLAGREQGPTATNQPRVAPELGPAAATSPGSAGQDLRGELVRVNTGKKVIVLRGENGMEQTLKYDDGTTVSGVGIEPLAKPGQNQTQKQMANLKNLKPGSELSIRWHGDAVNKTAVSVSVMSEGLKTPVRKR